jgi:hypothetical protein
MRQMARNEQKKISPYWFPEVSLTDATLQRILDASDHTHKVSEIREGVSDIIIGPQAYSAVLFRHCSHSHENNILQLKCANFLPDNIMQTLKICNTENI